MMNECQLTHLSGTLAPTRAYVLKLASLLADSTDCIVAGAARVVVVGVTTTSTPLRAAPPARLSTPLANLRTVA